MLWNFPIYGTGSSEAMMKTLAKKKDKFNEKDGSSTDGARIICGRGDCVTSQLDLEVNKHTLDDCTLSHGDIEQLKR